MKICLKVWIKLKRLSLGSWELISVWSWWLRLRNLRHPLSSVCFKQSLYQIRSWNQQLMLKITLVKKVIEMIKAKSRKELTLKVIKDTVVNHRSQSVKSKVKLICIQPNNTTNHNFNPYHRLKISNLKSLQQWGLKNLRKAKREIRKDSTSSRAKTPLSTATQSPVRTPKRKSNKSNLDQLKTWTTLM